MHMVSVEQIMSKYKAKTPEGVPFETDPGPLYRDEWSRVSYKRKAHTDVFDLANVEQRNKYTDIRQLIIDKKAALLSPVKSQPNKDGTGWIVLIEWCHLLANYNRPRYR